MFKAFLLTRKNRLVAQTLFNKAIEIGSIPLAEGIETRDDFEWLKQLGYQLFPRVFLELLGKPFSYLNLKSFMRKVSPI